MDFSGKKERGCSCGQFTKKFFCKRIWDFLVNKENTNWDFLLQISGLKKQSPNSLSSRGCLCFEVKCAFVCLCFLWWGRGQPKAISIIFKVVETEGHLNYFHLFLQYHTYLERRFSRWSNSCMVNVSIIQVGIICKHSSHVMCSSHQFAHSSCLTQPSYIIINMLWYQNSWRLKLSKGLILALLLWKITT